MGFWRGCGDYVQGRLDQGATLSLYTFWGCIEMGLLLRKITIQYGVSQSELSKHLQKARNSLPGSAKQLSLGFLQF